jgi:tetratricopeptide (TPR) repeat protein/uncharacterized membrane protein
MITSWLLRSARVGLLIGVVGGIAGGGTFGAERKPAAGQTPTAAGEPAASPERIHRLIRQLGDKDYYVRQHAQEELAQLGVDAFDALSAATEDEDPEIAARAKYLLHIPVEWTVKSDPPVVKRYLGTYGKRDAAERESVVRRLAVLPDDEGVDAVCRLVRFDRSPLLSKIAATALLPRDQAATAAQPATLNGIRRRLCGCPRPGAVWLGVLARFGSDPAAAVAEWSKLTESEYELWRQEPGKTSTEIVGCLLRFQVAWLNRLGKSADSARPLHRLLELEENGDAESLTDLAQWLVDRKVWSGLDELARRFSARCDNDPRLLYLLAEADAEQGRQKRAEETALRALQAGVRRSEQEEDGPTQMALWLEQRGRFAWAKREFEQVIAAGERALPGSDAQWRGPVAGIYLAEMLHDQDEDLDAANTLERIVKRIDSGSSGRILASQLRLVDHPPGEFRARMHYFSACHWESRHDLAKQHECLDKALTADPGDIDVLIACYRLPDEPRGYHAKIIDVIERTAITIHGKMANSPIPKFYNDYAWLIGNTEGDFDEAVKCSIKSLEMHPEEGGYYDTLGHVYFGKGDWEKAVKYQAIAAELDPHSGAIQRALAQFRKKLDDRKRAAK